MGGRISVLFWYLCETESMQKTAAAIALIITITICLAYLLILIKPLITGEPNPQGVTESMATIMGSMLSIISLFIGAVVGVVGKTIYDNRKKKSEENEDLE